MHVRDLFDLTGKVALVTGGSRGLGLQVAEALGELGATIAITARKPEELAAAAARLASAGVRCHSVTADLADFAVIPRLVDDVVSNAGPIDILVNNAGTTWGAPAESHPADAWMKVMDLNVNASFFLSQETARRCMIPRASGKIINMASIAGLSGGSVDFMAAAYKTSKAALINLTRALATEWGRFNINVNAICPGFFPSKMSQGALEKLAAGVIARTPLHRLGGDEDLKGVAVFLASDASRHVTGQYIAVDGGASIA
ncbi:MAG TPA: SDR family oxidoreductase [Steroidobacteraceae bacterium]|nr:SDR family oxidoreductase [Steroidobacteraceae bacterium]